MKQSAGYNFVNSENVVIATIVAVIAVIVTIVYFYRSNRKNDGNEDIAKKNDTSTTVADNTNDNTDVSNKSDEIRNEDSDDMSKLIEDPNEVKKYVRIMRNKTPFKEDLNSIDKEEEESAKARQLAQICALMKEKEDVFGEMSMDDLKSQMSLYY